MKTTDELLNEFGRAIGGATLAGDGSFYDRVTNARAAIAERLDRLAILDARVAQLEATDAACGEIHIICCDAGIPVGHVAQRVAELAARLETALEYTTILRNLMADMAVGTLEQQSDHTIAAAKITAFLDAPPTDGTECPICGHPLCHGQICTECEAQHG